MSFIRQLFETNTIGVMALCQAAMRCGLSRQRADYPALARDAAGRGIEVGHYRKPRSLGVFVERLESNR